jgi:hypothetical protein
MIENPQPAWLPILLLALPEIGFTAYALNGALFPSDDRPLCTIPAIGLVLALLPTHILALAFGSLSIGLAIAWGGVGAVGYFWIVRNWKKFHSALLLDRTGRARKLGITAVATIPILPAVILFNFFDEVSLTGHQAMIAHLQNGTYPPRYLYEPSLLLRYHYAFDLAGAVVTGLLRIRADQAIDLLTIALWPCMFLLLWRVGEHVGGKRAGLFVALAVSFSAGWCSLCTVFISFYFQHPWSIGLPVFCLVILQRAALRQQRSQTFGLVALVCSLTLLSLCQAVLFVTTVAALGLTEAWNFIQSRERSAAAVLVTLATAMICAKLIGGFFVSASYPPAEGLFQTAFYARDFSTLDAVVGQARQNLALSGLVLIPGALGLWRVRHERLFLALLAGIGFVVYNSLRYGHTDDIFKFATVSFIALAIGAGIFVSDLAHWADTPIRKLTRGALIVALLWKGVFFHFYVIWLYDPEARSPISVQMIRPYFLSNIRWMNMRRAPSIFCALIWVLQSLSIAQEKNLSRMESGAAFRRKLQFGLPIRKTTTHTGLASRSSRPGRTSTQSQKIGWIEWPHSASHGWSLMRTMPKSTIFWRARRRKVEPYSPHGTVGYGYLKSGSIRFRS